MPSMTDDSTLFHDSTIMTDSAFLSQQSSTLNLRSFNSSPPQGSMYASPPDRTNSYQTSFQEKLQSPPLIEPAQASQGLSVLQKLQLEGLFNFKNVSPDQNY